MINFLLKAFSAISMVKVTSSVFFHGNMCLWPVNELSWNHCSPECRKSDNGRMIFTFLWDCLFLLNMCAPNVTCNVTEGNYKISGSALNSPRRSSRTTAKCLLCENLDASSCNPPCAANTFTNCIFRLNCVTVLLKTNIFLMDRMIQICIHIQVH